MPTEPHVSVVIPTRDRREFVTDALASALAQRDVELEVIVVDDASVDDTSAVLRRGGDPRVRVVRQPSPRGVAAARNLGVEMAGGAWLAFLDDDDLWAPTWVSTALAVATRQGADIVYGSRLCLNERREPIFAALAERPDDVRARLRQINVFGGPSAVLARSDLVRGVGGFDSSFSALADWDLWLRIAALGRVAACADLLVGYTIHLGNMHVSGAHRALAEYRALRSKHPQEAGSFSELPLLRWIADDNRRFGNRSVAARLYLEAAVRHRSFPDVVRLAAAVFGSWGDNLLERSPYLRPSWLEPYAH